MEVRVHLNSHFLTITNYLIVSEQVCLLSLPNNEDRSCNGSWMISCSCWCVCFINAQCLRAKVRNNVTLNFLICNQDLVAISQVLILASERPRDLFA